MKPVLQETQTKSVQKTTSTSGSRALLFARNFFKHPRMLGSIVPSSRFLMSRILKQIDWKRGRIFIEYGPGVGNFTVEILKRMRPDATLIVFEMNGEFAEYLRSSIKDPRLHVVHGSAAEVQIKLHGLGWKHADYVLSGIPFSTMPCDVRDEILVVTRTALCPNGAFLVYQFSPSVLPHLQSAFARIERDFELLNVLPAHLFYCRH